MRLAIGTVLLLLLPLPALAQDDDPPAEEEATGTLRIEVAVETKLVGKRTKLNAFQYFVWERLHHFGVRVDSAKQIGRADLQKYVDHHQSRWGQREPDAAPASLKLSGLQTYDYNGSVFFGEVQAHNFKGRLEAELKDTGGQTLASFSFAFSWGKPVSRYTKSQTQQQFDKFVQTTLVLGLLKHAAIRSRMTDEKRKAADAWVAKERASLLRVLNNKTPAIRDGELAKFLRSLGQS